MERSVSVRLFGSCSHASGSIRDESDGLAAPWEP